MRQPTERTEMGLSLSSLKPELPVYLNLNFGSLPERTELGPQPTLYKKLRARTLRGGLCFFVLLGAAGEAPRPCGPAGGTAEQAGIRKAFRCYDAITPGKVMRLPFGPAVCLASPKETV